MLRSKMSCNEQSNLICGAGNSDQPLAETTVIRMITETLDKLPLKNHKVLVIIPDSTRSAPVPLFFRTIAQHLQDEVRQLDFLVALGTHPALTSEKLNQLLGITATECKERYAKVQFFNHAWDNPAQLQTIGVISADEIAAISNGLMRESVPITINNLIFNYDHLIIIGPTFPHEVVGFSGGNKYFFPGISGAEIINFFHWLGAVVTNPVINGTKNTPTRQVVDRAASFITVPRTCFSLVVHFDQLHGLYIGAPELAWSHAADLSARLHILYRSRPYHHVLGMAPRMYDDLWVGGKVMYKLEPVIADGGELIIYAPHIDQISYSHGALLERIGYHVLDYYLTRMAQFQDIPRGILAHSTHVKGIGHYRNGQEHPRIQVILATGISAERCRQINLGYQDYRSINPADWEGREAEGYLLVPKAGEMLYRLADGTVPRCN